MSRWTRAASPSGSWPDALFSPGLGGAEAASGSQRPHLRFHPGRVHPVRHPGGGQQRLCASGGDGTARPSLHPSRFGSPLPYPMSPRSRACLALRSPRRKSIWAAISASPEMWSRSHGPSRASSRRIRKSPFPRDQLQAFEKTRTGAVISSHPGAGLRLEGGRYRADHQRHPVHRGSGIWSFQILAVVEDTDFADFRLMVGNYAYFDKARAANQGTVSTRHRADR